MSGIIETYIMWISFKGTVILQCHLSICFPSHKILGELKGAVFDQFGIEASISGIVDIFKKQTVHRRLNFCTLPVGTDDHLICLGMDGKTISECQQGYEKTLVILHV